MYKAETIEEFSKRNDKPLSEKPEEVLAMYNSSSYYAPPPLATLQSKRAGATMAHHAIAFKGMHGRLPGERELGDYVAQLEHAAAPAAADPRVVAAANKFRDDWGGGKK